jgi:hypothetical protein
MFRDCYVTIAPGTLEDLSVAPEKLQGPYGGYGFDVGPGVYVIKTSDGLYVKFDNLSYILNNTYYVTLEYYVQTDGTPNFGPSVAVQPTTWGRVKALYR